MCAVLLEGPRLMSFEARASKTGPLVFICDFEGFRIFRSHLACVSKNPTVMIRLSWRGVGGAAIAEF